MDKLGVDTEKKHKDLEKEGAYAAVCPKCGAKLDTGVNVPCCPNCGTAPFEEKADEG